MSSHQHHQRPQGNPHLPAAGRVRRRRRTSSAAEYERSRGLGRERPGGLLGRAGRSRSHWFKPLDKVLDCERAVRQVVRRRQVNVSYNCLDRHLTNGREEQGRDHLGRRAGRHAHAHLPGAAPRSLQVRQRAQDARRQARATASRSTCRWSPKLAIAMLACARIGAAHRVIFGGFRAEAVADRNNDAKAKLVITADGGWRRGKVVPLKANVDDAPGQVADRREVHRLQPLQSAGRR